MLGGGGRVSDALPTKIFSGLFLCNGLLSINKMILIKVVCPIFQPDYELHIMTMM